MPAISHPDKLLDQKISIIAVYFPKQSLTHIANIFLVNEHVGESDDIAHP